MSVSVRGMGAAGAGGGLGPAALEVRVRLRGLTALDSVRRNLFGSEGREENRRFVERELDRQLELDSERWGFDFARERPLPGAQRFAWQLVSADGLPRALRRPPLPAPAPAPAPALQPPPSPAQLPPSPQSSAKNQKRITDFLKPRKRLSTSAAKKSSPNHKHDCSGHGTHIRPPKVARIAQPHFKRS